jgi:glycerophosphoryl diester phosphodiesterase
MWIIGHRGAAGTTPENTLASIADALNCGVDWIEIDVRMIDDTIIVLHDETLDRTTDGSGSVYKHSLAELRSLDAGKGEKIPLLTEVMQLIDARAGLNIEIKQHDVVDSLVTLIKPFIKQQPAWRDRLMFSSFMPKVMSQLSAVSTSGCLIGALSEANKGNAIPFATGLNAYSVNIPLKQLSQSMVYMAHERGLKVLVYTVNNVADIRRCYELSVDGIFTDFPDRSIAFIKNDL